MRKTSKKDRRWNLPQSALLTTAALGLTVIGPMQAPAVEDEDFSNIPMETRVVSSPPNIMFILDNSGSMQFSFVTDGKGADYNVNKAGYQFVYDLPGNNSYFMALNGVGRLWWHSQWSGGNKLFYNPHFNYIPWPKWNELPGTDGAGSSLGFNADLPRPRVNPVNDRNTMYLYGQYASIYPKDISNAIVVDTSQKKTYYWEVIYSGGYIYSGFDYWKDSSSLPKIGGKPRYLEKGTIGAARFEPYLAGGKYSIQAFWNCYKKRDENALMRLWVHNGSNWINKGESRLSQKASLNGIPETGICGEWVNLFDAVDLPSGKKTRVEIVRDKYSTGDSTVANAVRFIPDSVKPSVRINNAHYYAVDDKDGDGEVDAGEGVYLVNFIWDRASGKTKREYYSTELSGNGNAQVIKSLTKLDISKVPDTIRPKKYDESGNPDGYISDEADLQNFANWFSFYRNRDLTAKAAVSRTINDLEKVKVGFYTLQGDHGVRQPVEPLKVETSGEVIVDRGGNGRKFSATYWYDSGATPIYPGSEAKWTGQKGANVVFKPELAAGNYDVYGWWPCYDNADTYAEIRIAGNPTIHVNQKATSDGTITEGTCLVSSQTSDTGCCGYWVKLGNYDFPQLNGNTEAIKILRVSGSDNSVPTYGNAVKFEMAGGTTTVDKTGFLLDKLYAVTPGGGTPLRRALLNVGRYFDDTDGNDGNLGQSPYLSKEEGGACQQCFAIAMTDGLWNGYSPGVEHQDQGKGAPYADDYSNTLADVAMKYYERDLSSKLPNEVPGNSYDQKDSQHMVTYSVSFGQEGTIPLDDINKDGVTDSPSYAEDPYFLNDKTPRPTWPNVAKNSKTTIDDLWHASVNGRGRFFSAKSPESLVNSIKAIFEDIEGRTASSASVSLNGDELKAGLVMYQSSYEPGAWTGNVTAYPIDKDSGEVQNDADHIIWQAAKKLQNQTGRVMITYDGKKGKPFKYDSLAPAMQKALGSDDKVVDYLHGEKVDGFRVRRQLLGDIVHSAPVLVDALYPENDGYDNDGDGSTDNGGEKGGTIFAGGNDGMLHAFNAVTGEERFAYLPLGSFDYLKDLTSEAFSHRYYVDGTPVYKRLSFYSWDCTKDGLDNDLDGKIDGDDDDKDGCLATFADIKDNDHDGETDEVGEARTMTMLVGGLGKGGRGIYALDISDADKFGPGKNQSLDEEEAAKMVMWEYPPAASLEWAFAGDNNKVGAVPDPDKDFHDDLDNDGDGVIDEEGEIWLLRKDAAGNEDPDIGYTYGTPFIGRSYKSTNEGYVAVDSAGYNEKDSSPWVVIFANGYKSKNGHAVLYVLDALTGKLLRKIDTGAGPDNGLSSPVAVDVDNDDRVDFVYAGDLLGNMWKFDLRDKDPEKWGVFYGVDGDTPANRIDAADTGDEPQPLFSSPLMPITTKPQVMFHCKKDGYMVLFGTGKFMGREDRSNFNKQAFFGVWDYGTEADQYLGTFNRTDNTLTNFSKIDEEKQPRMLEQTQIYWQEYTRKDGTKTHLRGISDHAANWYIECDEDGKCTPFSDKTYLNDGIDNNGDGVTAVDGDTDENIGHVGWYFILPRMKDASSDGIDNDGDGATDEAGEEKFAGERVVKDVIIRDGKLIGLSFTPNDSPCSGGGSSILHDICACSGARLDKEVFDIDGDGKIDENDNVVEVEVDGKKVLIPVSGIEYDGMGNKPAIVEDPDSDPKKEKKIISTSTGAIETIWEASGRAGLYYWIEH